MKSLWLAFMDLLVRFTVSLGQYCDFTTLGKQKFNFVMTCGDNLPVLSLPFQIIIASYNSVFYTIHFLNECFSWSFQMETVSF